jgi:hypothetical protein
MTTIPPLPLARLEQYGNVPTKRIADQSRFVCNTVSVHFREMGIRQVAVKSLHMTEQDNTIKKNSQASASTKVYITTHAKCCHFAEDAA